jgi:hypothetical protein
MNILLSDYALKLKLLQFLKLYFVIFTAEAAGTYPDLWQTIAGFRFRRRNVGTVDRAVGCHTRTEV